MIDGGSSADAASRGPTPDAAPPAPDAAQSPPPARIIIFFTPHGTYINSWRPTVQAGGTLTLGPILSPLEAWKARLLIVEGLWNRATATALAAPHGAGQHLLLTGRALPGPGGFRPAFVSGGPSLDFVLGQQWGRATMLPALHVGVRSGSQPDSAISFSAANEPIVVENDPTRAFAKLGLPGPGPAPLDMTVNDNFPKIGRNQMDLIVGAFAADKTRVATLRWLEHAPNFAFTWLGQQALYHEYLHETIAVRSQAEPEVIRIQNWLAGEFGYLLGKLNEVRQGSGTLLDHTLVVWLSEAGSPPVAHSARGFPVVIAGNLNGRFRNGAYVQVPGRSQADLLVTIAQAAGIPFTPDPAITTGPIRELLK